MPEAKAPRAAGNKVVPFGNIRTVDPLVAERAMHVASVYGIRPKETTLDKFEAAKRALAEAKLQPDKRARLERYAALVTAKTEDSFALLQAVEIIMSYLSGELKEKELGFEFRLMEAWCSGSITSFLKDEAGKAKSKPARDMAEAALTKSDVMQAFAAAQFSRFYKGGLMELMRRKRVFRECAEVIRETPDV